MQCFPIKKISAKNNIKHVLGKKIIFLIKHEKGTMKTLQTF